MTSASRYPEELPVKLDVGQKHLLRLIDKDAGADGWTPVSSVVYPLLETNLPKELIVLERVGTEGRGRAKLTQHGESIVEAMAWL